MLLSSCPNSSIRFMLLRLSQFSVCSCSIYAATANLSQFLVYHYGIFAAAADAYSCIAWQHVVLHAKSSHMCTAISYC